MITTALDCLPPNAPAPQGYCLLRQFTEDFTIEQAIEDSPLVVGTRLHLGLIWQRGCWKFMNYRGEWIQPTFHPRGWRVWIQAGEGGDTHFVWQQERWQRAAETT